MVAGKMLSAISFEVVMVNLSLVTEFQRLVSGIVHLSPFRSLTSMITCLGKGLKACSANINAFDTAHSYTHRTHVSELIAPQAILSPYDDTAEREVFMKTFAFFCALEEHGCAFWTTADFIDFVNIDVENDSDDESDSGTATVSQKSSCPGKLIMHTDRYNQRFIQ